MDPLEEMMWNWIGSAFTVRVYPARGNLLATIPNRYSEYQSLPVTRESLRTAHGPGRYRVLMVGNGEDGATVLGRIYAEADVDVA